MLTLHDKKVNKEGFAVVANVADNIEFEMIKSLLNEEGIKILDKRSGSGSYLNVIHGFNYQGIDILVHESDYEKTADILIEFSTAEFEGENIEENWEEEVKESSDKRRKWFFNLYFIIPGIIMVIALLVSSLLN